MSGREPDPRTAAALDRVRAELAALPEIEMPPDVADRIGRTLAGTRPDKATEPPDGGATPSDGEPAAPTLGRTPRRRRTGGRGRIAAVAGALAAAAVLLVVLLVAVPRDGGGPVPVDRADDLATAGGVAFGRDGAGPLADPMRRRGCLIAAGVPDPDATLLGGLPHVVDGRPGTLLVLSTGVAGRFRIVVVDPACGPSGGRVLGQAVTGR